MGRRCTGVALADGREGVPAKAHVHMACGAWQITSSVPCGPALLEADVLDRALPGALGRYVYPADAVLCVPSKQTTVRADLERLLAAERVDDALEEAHVNHLSVSRPEGDVAEEDEEEDEEVSDVENEEEEEGRPQEVEEAWSEDDDTVPKGTGTASGVVTRSV
tara:strand:- start:581 stop:1072 length:492 start_codon:yes stop_codon:yes gene_type:complete